MGRQGCYEFDVKYRMIWIEDRGGHFLFLTSSDDSLSFPLSPSLPFDSTLYMFSLFIIVLGFTYGWNFSRCIFSPNIVTFFATLTAVFEHFLHWFDCFNYFYGSITCATVGKTKFLTLHLRLGTWEQPLNMDDFEVFSHLFPFCISSYKP